MDQGAIRYCRGDIAQTFADIAALFKGNGKGKDQSHTDNATLPMALWATGKTDSAGAQICNMFNDVRGCKQWCPSGRSHVCDVLLTSGKTCLAKSHARNAHIPAQHGTPKSKKEVPKGDRR